MRWAALLLLVLSACDDAIDAGGAESDAGAQDDPLLFPDVPPEAGTLAHIHRSIILPSCAGQPGLCHAGQFEPNLSTPASFYASLVNRPGLEQKQMLRVRPGRPESSLLIDKLRGRNVATQMPLGAEPLAEAQIAEIEQWITSGALRAPGAEPAPVLNELPMEPEIGLFDAAGNRLDGAGPVVVAPGQTVTLRQSVEDFETADEDIPAAVFILATGEGQNLVVNPGAVNDPHVARALYDPNAPSGRGDTLAYRFEWTVPAVGALRDDATGAITPDVPLAGRSFAVIAVYIDQIGAQGMSSIGFRLNAVQVQP